MVTGLVDCALYRYSCCSWIATLLQYAAQGECFPCVSQCTKFVYIGIPIIQLTYFLHSTTNISVLCHYFGGWVLSEKRRAILSRSEGSRAAWVLRRGQTAPLHQLEDLRSAVTPAPKLNLMHFSWQIWHLVTIQICCRSTNQNSVRTAGLRCLWSRHLEYSSPCYSYHRFLPCFPAFAKTHLFHLAFHVFIIDYCDASWPIFFVLLGTITFIYDYDYGYDILIDTSPFEIDWTLKRHPAPSWLFKRR